MKVSVIIPVYNVEHYLARCLDSVLHQTYYDIEIIMVDDASSDGSMAIAEQYQKQYRNIVLVKHKRNQGLMMTRRDGYLVATGEWIMFLDSDDALPKDAVEKLVNKQVETNADIVMGDLMKYYVDGTTERVVGSLDTDATKIEVLSALIELRVAHSLCGKLYKMDLFRKGDLQTFNSLTIAEDGCLFYQLVAKTERMASLHAIVYDYYENKASSSLHTYGVNQVENVIVAYQVIASICKPYAMLHDKLEYRLTKVMFALYFERITIRKVRELLRKHEMLNYGSLKNACKILKWKDYWFCMKRFIYVRTMLKK